jgi:hypothetical protein
MKFTPGKYRGHKFTANQRKARGIWQRMQTHTLEIADALRTSPDSPTGKDRATLHTRLDHVLDNIERGEEAARELFPEVQESFTLFSGRL